jgi:glycosyltransferase involved in cell wall biosynthesis
MTKISVIIPCFNLGKYLEEAVESVLSQTFPDFEIIIVNDGSTDKETLRILNEFNNPKIQVIHTPNQGLASARNAGITRAKGDYILPLDADDLLESTYLEKAVKVLDENDNVGIVYCEAVFFGDEQGKWELPKYSLQQILLHNVIFSTAMFRKSDWVKAGGYKANMIYGWEDYDLWLSIIELKREVYKIPESLFFYRRRRDSMTDQMKLNHHLYSYKEIFKNHRQLYADNIDCIFEHMCVLNEENKRLIEKISKLHQDQSVLRMEVFNWRVLSHHLLRFISKKLSVFFGRGKEQKKFPTVPNEKRL